MITLVPYGGLANRIKAIDSALALAHDTGTRLRVLWFRDEGLNCRFDQLFLPVNSSAIVIREAKWWDYLLFDRSRKKNFYVPGFFQKIIFRSCIGENDSTRLMQTNFDFASWAQTNKKCYIAACVYFYKPQRHNFFSLFKPMEELRVELQKRTASFDAHTYGVHVRRTDHLRSITDSPTELFATHMRDIVAEDPRANFYLASDSDEDKRHLSALFPGRVSFGHKTAHRNSRSGMQDALVELYALSKTVAIIASSTSSFSETAARIGTISCHYVRTVKKVLTIVVTRNNEGRIQDTLRSLLSSDHPTQIWICDNASTDSTLALVSRMFPALRIIRNEHPLEFGDVANIAVRIAQDEGFDHIFLTNGTVIVSPSQIRDSLHNAKPNGLLGQTPVSLIGNNSVSPFPFSYTQPYNNRINIAIAADSNYMVPLTTLLESIFVNNPENNMHIYLLYIEGAINAADFQFIESYIECHEGNLHPLKVLKSGLDSFPETRHSKSALLRLFLPHLAPEVDKILYLDGDVIVRKSLSEIYNTDISSYYVAAVRDTITIYSPDYLTSLGIDRTAFYFNSGVCLMNLDALRACDFMQQGIDFIRHNFHKTGFPDQDFLNYLCQEKVLFLPPKYNFNFVVHRDVAQMIWSDREIRETKLDPVIVHFVGPVKPWSLLCVHRYRKEWWRFLRQTPLRDYRPKDMNLKNILFKAYLSVAKPVDAMFTLKQKQQVGRLIPLELKRKIKGSLLRNKD